MRIGVLALLAVLVMGLLAGAETSAQTNPFTGRTAAETSAPPEDPGIWHRIGVWILTTQKTINRNISETLRDIRTGDSGWALLTGILVAFLYGVVHAVGPGHGKMIVASYFLSRDARPWHGFVMGGQIAFFHVISAIVAVTVADFLLRRTLGGPPGAVQEVKLVSYGLIAAIGIWMLIQAIRGTGHAHCHDHDHEGGHGAGKSRGLLSFGVGIVPCTGAVLILIYALANDILVAGLLMVSAIAIGMSMTMVALGLVAIVARTFMVRRMAKSEQGTATLGRVISGVGAIFIILIGAGLMAGELTGNPLLPGEF